MERDPQQIAVEPARLKAGHVHVDAGPGKILVDHPSHKGLTFDAGDDHVDVRVEGGAGGRYNRVTVPWGVEMKHMVVLLVALAWTCAPALATDPLGLLEAQGEAKADYSPALKADCTIASDDHSKVDSLELDTDGRTGWITLDGQKLPAIQTAANNAVSIDASNTHVHITRGSSTAEVDTRWFLLFSSHASGPCNIYDY